MQPERSCRRRASSGRSTRIWSSPLAAGLPGGCARAGSRTASPERSSQVPTICPRYRVDLNRQRSDRFLLRLGIQSQNHHGGGCNGGRRNRYGQESVVRDLYGESNARRGCTSTIRTWPLRFRAALTTSGAVVPDIPTTTVCRSSAPGSTLRRSRRIRARRHPQHD